MMWCLTLAFAALVAAGFGPIGAMPHAAHAATTSGSVMALAGLAGILGLVGALLGAAVASGSVERRMVAFESRTLTTSSRPSGHTAVTAEAARRMPPQPESSETGH